jgi:uncharacterized beta-barrel protein YwiB (DUF1934 family)
MRHDISKRQEVNIKLPLTLDIDKEIIKETIRCGCNFHCLKHKKDNCLLMKVDGCVSNAVLFVKCTNTTCSYKMNFGSSIICNCPTRREIFIKYKK